MASVYILYSKNIDKYYIGSCKNLNLRLIQHNSGIYINSFTHRSQDWIVYFSIDDIEYGKSRSIEKHIKQMKSRKYLENIKKYPEMVEKLIEKY